MDMLIFVARMVLTLVLAVAGFTKLADRPGTKKAVVEFGVPLQFARPIASVLPLAEFAAALMLLIRTTAWWGSLAALALLFIFTIGIAYNLWKGRRPDCHCFGQLHSSPIGWSTLVRNGVLLLMAGFVAWRGPDQPGLHAAILLTSISIWSFLIVLFGVFVMGAIGIQTWFVLNLMRQNGRLLQRIEALETRLGIGGAHSAPAQRLGLPVGSPAPPFNLPQLDKAHLSLDALRSDGKPVLLLFSDPNCGPCNALLPTAALWQRQYASTVRIIVISSGPLETNHMKQQEFGLTEVLLQKDREVATLYQAYGTPSAVLVRTNGTIGSDLAPGAEAISALVSTVTANSTERLLSLSTADRLGSTVQRLYEAGNGPPFPRLSKVEIWNGPLSWEGQQSNIRLTLRDNNGTITGQMQAIDPLNAQLVEMGDITGTRTGNGLNLSTHTGLQITAELTANTLIGQVNFPESYGEASITAKFTLTPVSRGCLPSMFNRIVINRREQRAAPSA